MKYHFLYTPLHPRPVFHERKSGVKQVFGVKMACSPKARSPSKQTSCIMGRYCAYYERVPLYAGHALYLFLSFFVSPAQSVNWGQCEWHEEAYLWRQHRAEESAAATTAAAASAAAVVTTE